MEERQDIKRVCIKFSGASPIKHLSVGFPLPCTELRIYDKVNDVDVQEPGTWGSVLVKGPQVMKGYHNNEEATKEVTIRKEERCRRLEIVGVPKEESVGECSDFSKVLSKDGWLTTGDVGYVDDEGYVYIVDREKDVIRYKKFFNFTRPLFQLESSP